jgi:hypothetical protein
MLYFQVNGTSHKPLLKVVYDLSVTARLRHRIVQPRRVNPRNLFIDEFAGQDDIHANFGPLTFRHLPIYKRRKLEQNPSSSQILFYIVGCHD